MKADRPNDDASLPLAERVAYLIAGYLSGTLTEAEHRELDAWVEASEANMRLFEKLTDEDQLEAAQQWYQQKQADVKSRQRAWRSIQEGAGLRRRRFPRSYLWMAAVVVVLAVAGAVLLRSMQRDPAPALPANGPVVATAVPGGNHAVLTLANGRTIFLDNAKNGQLASEAGVAIRKNDTEVVYNGEASTGTPVYNTLSTPNGGQYKIVLPDGSRVWLNAASWLRFPAAFAGTGRRVELEGEGYFEVAPNKEKPFIVTARGSTVEVLGTHFNIHAYTNNDITVTLLEGRVKAGYNQQSKLLAPGHAALMNEKGITVQAADTVAVTGWRNGLFVFRNAPIATVAEQLSRWYDVEVVVEGKITDGFRATFSRQEPLARVLEVLEQTGGARFEVKGKKVVVKNIEQTNKE